MRAVYAIPARADKPPQFPRQQKLLRSRPQRLAREIFPDEWCDLRHDGGKPAAQFALGYDIRASAQFGQCFDDCLIGIGLHGIANKSACAFQTVRKHFEMAL